MKVETILGATIAATLLFLTGFLALLTQENVVEVADIGQVQWVILGIGALIGFLKDFQALSIRRGISKMTGKGG